MDLLVQPRLHSSEVATPEIVFEARKIALGLRHELRRVKVAQRVSREITQSTHAPVDVLEAAEPVVRRRQIEHLPELVVPCARHVGRQQIARENRELQFEAQNNVQVVGRLVGLDPDEGRLRLVDREIKVVEAHFAQRIDENLLGAGEEMPPERSAAADLVFP